MNKQYVIEAYRQGDIIHVEARLNTGRASQRGTFLYGEKIDLLNDKLVFGKSIRQLEAEAIKRISEKAEQKLKEMQLNYKDQVTNNPNAVISVNRDHVQWLLDNKVEVVVCQRSDDSPLGTSTFAHAYLKLNENEKFYLATSHSACVHESDYNKELGAELAVKRALNDAKSRLFELSGFIAFSNKNNFNLLDTSISQPVNK